MLEDRLCRYASHRFACVRIDQRIETVSLDRAHEGVRDADGNIEVGQLMGAPLGLDEFENIRMIDAQYPHIGPTARPSLFDDVRRGVKNAHERNGSGRDTVGGGHHVVLRTQVGEGEAGPAARLMDQRLVLERVIDRFE